MILGGREQSPHEIPLYLKESAAPIDVAPLEGEQLAKSQPGPHATEDPGVPLREFDTCLLNQ
jgi:hypothetical protein